MTFHEFVGMRWAEVEKRLSLPKGTVQVTWEIKDGYPHFKKKRGYAVCFNFPNGACHMQYAPKILKAPIDRIDGLVRHEIGHVVDFVIPAHNLDPLKLV